MIGGVFAMYLPIAMIHPEPNDRDVAALGCISQTEMFYKSKSVVIIAVSALYCS